MYSLKRKLHRNLLIALVLSMITLLYALNQGVKQLSQDYVSSRLQHDSDSIISALSQTQNGSWKLPHERMSTVYSRVNSGHYYVVTVDSQKIRSRSLFDHDPIVPSILLSENRLYIEQGIGKERWLISLQAIKKKGRTITLWVAEDIAPLEQTQHQFMLLAAGVTGATILFLLLIQYQILQRGFSQLEQLRTSIKQMRLGTKDITQQPLPTEILPLVEEIRRLMGQLSQRVQRSRNALGNVAHELKRPLQRYQSLIETLSPESRQQGDAILKAFNNVIDRELKRARIAGISTPGRQTVIKDELEPLIKVMQSIYPSKSIEAKQPQDLVMPQDRDDMLELLGNLLDNGCKYAKANTLIHFEALNNGWRITIEDDGKGVSKNDLEIISGRGIRLDESIQGHGLGLSICKDIVESYSGSLHFQQSGLGGLKVTIFLPRLEP